MSYKPSTNKFPSACIQPIFHTMCTTSIHLYDLCVKVHEVKLFWSYCNDLVTHIFFLCSDEISSWPKELLNHPNLMNVVKSKIRFSFTSFLQTTSSCIIQKILSERTFFHWVNTEDKYQGVQTNHAESLGILLSQFLLTVLTSFKRFSLSALSHQWDLYKMCSFSLSSQFLFLSLLFYLCLSEILSYSVWSIQVLSVRSNIQHFSTYTVHSCCSS